VGASRFDALMALGLIAFARGGTLIQHPEGVAGAFYKRRHRSSKSRERGPSGRLEAAPAVKQ
jgi:hypothetical protein